MEITQRDIEEFAEQAQPADLRRYALTTAQILTKTQLKALQRYFSRPIVFSVPRAQSAAEAEETAPEEDDDDDIQDDEEELPPPPKKPAIDVPAKSAQDFGFGDAPRRGRPPKEQAAQEADEVLKRRPADDFEELLKKRKPLFSR